MKYAILASLLWTAAASAAPLSDTLAARQARGEYLRATLLERTGAYAEALTAYEKAMAMDPSAAFIAGEAAELALQLEDYARAEKYARRRLDLAPGDAKSRAILARVLWARGDVEAAEAEFARALQSDPTSADVLFGLTELVAARDPAKARKMLEDFLSRNPEQAARALLALGRLDAQQGRYTDAMGKLKRSIALDDAESDPARLALAQVYEVLGDTEAAIVEFRRISNDAPDDFPLWAHVGELQGLAGKREDARATFRRLKEKHPGDPAACAWLAADAEKDGDFKTAAERLSESTALKDDPTLTLRLGYYQLQAGGLKEAVATLKEGRRHWPKDDRIAYYLALGRDDLGEHETAVALLRDSLALKPDDHDARWQLATILEKLGRYDEALPEFRRLIAEKPDDASALNYLGYMMAEKGQRLEEALLLIRRALIIEPTNPAYRDSLGWTLFKLGRSTEAAAELRASALALPDDDSVWDHVGEVRRGQGDEEGAWRAWRLSESLGGKAAGRKAEALQKDLTVAAVGELWRRHLSDVHGGVAKFSGVCDVTGKVGTVGLSQKALVSYRVPGHLTVEILGPMFSTLARARVEGGGFSMDRLPVEGLDPSKAAAAAEALLTSVAAALGGEPFAPGPARLDLGWGGARSLVRPGWRVELSDGAPLERSVRATEKPALEILDFAKIGMKRIPRSFKAGGAFWDFSLNCAEPKIEFEAGTEFPR